MSGLLWFYSTTYKRQVLLGNFMVAFMVAFVPLLLLFFEMPLLLEKYNFYIKALPTNLKLMVVWILGYSLFAFLLTFIREIIKDMEDFEGDSAFGRNTIPIAWGSGVAKSIIYFLLFITLFFVALATYRLRWNSITVFYSILLIILPVILTGILIAKAKNKNNYHWASTIIKLIMLSGLLYNIVAYFRIF